MVKSLDLRRLGWALLLSILMTSYCKLKSCVLFAPAREERQNGEA